MNANEVLRTINKPVDRAMEFIPAEQRDVHVGEKAEHRKFKVTGEYLSYDPYGIMFRKGEPQLKAVVERTFQKLGSGRDLIPLYNKWFVGRLPTGEKLGVSISPQLEEAFKVLDGTQGNN